MAAIAKDMPAKKTMLMSWVGDIGPYSGVNGIKSHQVAKILSKIA